MMEYRMSSYRAIMASTRAILNAEATDTSLLPPLDVPSLAGRWSLDGSMDATGGEEDRRYHLVHDLLRSERNFLRQLQAVLDVYAEPFRKFTSLPAEDHRILFVGIEPILSLSAMVTSKLDDAVQTWDPTTSKIGNLFSRKLWNHYKEYVDGYPTIRHCLVEKYSHDPDFVEFCDLRRGNATHTLEDLLYLPVQRIPDYDKYLNELLKETDPAHPDFEDLSRAADRVQKMVKEREYEEGNMDNQRRLERVQDKFPQDDLQLHDLEAMQKRQLASRRKSAPGAVLFRSLGKSKSTGNLLSQNVLGKKDLEFLRPSRQQCAFNRQYLMEGPVELALGVQTQDRYLFLFSDLLLIAKQKSTTTFKLKHRIRVAELWISFCFDEVSYLTRPQERSFVFGWPTTNVVATFQSAELKDTWLNKFTEQIREERMKQLPNHLGVEIFNKDFDKPYSVEVGSTTEAAEILKQCVDHFQISESEAKDYQLWVRVGNDESPCPLIGHELPYAIKLSQIRDFGKKSDEALTATEVEQIVSEMQQTTRKYEFILKHNKKSPKKSLEENASKTLKKNKKSPLINLFRRHREDKKPQGKLFGHQLADITSPENLIAKPVRELMTILFREGPYTVGILRKSPNARMCKELRQKLDDGEDCFSNETWPSLVIGALLKEFLRNIPQSLLMEELFDDWISCNELTDGDDKVTKYRETLGKLTPAHYELLRHLMCVLWHIDSKKDENKMNSYNLSVCIAPSLLWPKGNQDPLATPATIIQYMVEQFPQLFGEESITLFGETVEQKIRRDSSTDSDSMHSVLSNFRQDDSSIDSLDREILYNRDIDSSPQLLKSHHLSPSNLSGDSGLCDEDGNGNDVSDRRQYSRSASHYLERDLERPDTEETSRSLDNHYYYADGHSNPVPPPRKGRRKGPEPHQMSPNLESYRKNPKYTNYGGSGKYDKSRYSSEQYRQLYKRRSSESLKSVEESSEADSEVNVKGWRRQEDMGTLIKSASGAHLYYDECNTQRVYEFDTYNENIKGRARPSNRSVPLSPQSKYSLSSSHDSVLSDSSGSFLNRQYSPDHLSSPADTPDNEDRGMNQWLAQQSKQTVYGRSRQRQYSQDDSELGLTSGKFSDNKTNSQSQSDQNVRYQASPKTSPKVKTRAPLPKHTPVNVRYSFPMQHSTSPIGSGSNTSKEAEDIIQSPKIAVHYPSQESLDQPDPPARDKAVTPHLDLFNDNSMMKQISMYSAGLQGNSPPPRVVLQGLNASQHQDSKRDSSKPLKAVHDSAIISQMRRNSVDTLEDSVSSETEESSSSSDSDVETYRVTTVVKMRPFTNSIPQTLVKDRESPVRKPTFTKLTVPAEPKPVENSVVESPVRPSNPPSYKDAVKRNFMLRNGIPLQEDSDEEDTEKQHEASLRAKQLYEQSMRQYLEQRDRYQPPSQMFEQKLDVLGERHEDVLSQESSDFSSEEDEPKPEKNPRILYEESLRRYQDELSSDRARAPLVKRTSQDDSVSPTKGAGASNRNLLGVKNVHRSFSDVGDSSYIREALIRNRSRQSGTSPARSTSRDTTPTSRGSAPSSRESTPTKRPEQPPPYDAPPAYRKTSPNPVNRDRHQFPTAAQYVSQSQSELKRTNSASPHRPSPHSDRLSPHSDRSGAIVHSRESSVDSLSSSASRSGREQPRLSSSPAKTSHPDTRSSAHSVRDSYSRHRIAVSAAQNPRDTNRSAKRVSSSNNRDTSAPSRDSTTEQSHASSSSSARNTSASVFRPRASSLEPSDKRDLMMARASSTETSQARVVPVVRSSQQPVRSREGVTGHRDYRRASLDCTRQAIDARVSRNGQVSRSDVRELPWSVKQLSHLFSGNGSPGPRETTPPARAASASPSRPSEPPPYNPPPPFQRQNDNMRSSTSSNSSVSSAGTGRNISATRRVNKHGGPQARESFSSTDDSECSCRYSLSCRRDNSSMEDLDNLSFTDITYV